MTTGVNRKTGRVSRLLFRSVFAAGILTGGSVALSVENEQVGQWLRRSLPAEAKPVLADVQAVYANTKQASIDSTS